jgi:hypothetical protein
MACTPRVYRPFPLAFSLTLVFSAQTPPLFQKGKTDFRWLSCRAKGAATH